MYKIYEESLSRDPEEQAIEHLKDFGDPGVSPGYAAAYLGISRQAVDKACQKGSLRGCKIFLEGKHTGTLIDTRSLKAYKELRDLNGGRIPYRARAIA